MLMQRIGCLVQWYMKRLACLVKIRTSHLCLAGPLANSYGNSIGFDFRHESPGRVNHYWPSYMAQYLCEVLLANTPAEGRGLAGLHPS